MARSETDRTAALDRLLDRQEIYDTLMRYCRGSDRRDRELLESAFHPGAVDDHGTPAPYEQLLDAVMAMEVPQLMHLVGNVTIEVEGDIAYSEAYFVSYSPVVQDSATFTRTRAGRYLDRFERRAGEWRIAHRMIVSDWARLDPIVGLPEDAGGVRGLRSAADPVFRMRELLA